MTTPTARLAGLDAARDRFARLVDAGTFRSGLTFTADTITDAPLDALLDTYAMFRDDARVLRSRGLDFAARAADENAVAIRYEIERRVAS